MQTVFPVSLGALSFWMVFVLVLLAYSKFWTKMQVTSLICHATPCLAIPLAIRGFIPHCLQLGVVRLLLLIVVRAWMPSFSQKSSVHVDTSKYSWSVLRRNIPWKSDLKSDLWPSGMLSAAANLRSVASQKSEGFNNTAAEARNLA